MAGEQVAVAESGNVSVAARQAVSAGVRHSGLGPGAGDPGLARTRPRMTTGPLAAGDGKAEKKRGKSPETSHGRIPSPPGTSLPNGNLPLQGTPSQPRNRALRQPAAARQVKQAAMGLQQPPRSLEVWNRHPPLVSRALCRPEG